MNEPLEDSQARWWGRELQDQAVLIWPWEEVARLELCLFYTWGTEAPGGTRTGGKKLGQKGL